MGAFPETVPRKYCISETSLLSETREINVGQFL